MSFGSYLSASIQNHTILLTKTTAAQNGVAHSYHRVRGLYFLAVVFVRSIVHVIITNLEVAHELRVVPICKYTEPYYTSHKNNCRTKWSRA